MDLENTRRTFLGAVGMGALLAGGAGQALAQADGDGTTEPDINKVCLFQGPRTELSRFGGSFEPREGYNYLYFTEHGEQFYTTASMDRWEKLPTSLKVMHRSDLPATSDVPAGTMYLLDSARIPVWNDGNAWEVPNFTDDVVTSSTVVSNTTAETTIYTDDVDAGSFIPGRQNTTEIFGNFSTVNNSVTFDLRFYVEGSQVAILSNVGANVLNAPVSAEMHLTIRDNDMVSTHTVGRVNENVTSQNNPQTSLTTGPAMSIEVTVQWSAADPGNEFVITQGFSEQRNFDYQ